MDDDYDMIVRVTDIVHFKKEYSTWIFSHFSCNVAATDNLFDQPTDCLPRPKSVFFRYSTAIGTNLFEGSFFIRPDVLKRLPPFDWNCPHLVWLYSFAGTRLFRDRTDLDLRPPEPDIFL